jgi:hypothetical protein
LAASFAAGGFVAFLADAFYVLRLPLMPQHRRYTVPAIQKAVQSRPQTGGAKGRKSIAVALFCTDVLLCLIGAIALILILYCFNNGVFRAVAPLSFAVGVTVWHFYLSKWARILLQWIVFGIETLIYVLLLPIRRIIALCIKLCKANAQKRHKRRQKRQRQIHTDRELQSIDKASQALLQFFTK